VISNRYKESTKYEILKGLNFKTTYAMRSKNDAIDNHIEVE